MTSFLTDAQTPEHWLAQLRVNGIRISARRLRERARECGQFYCLGRTVFLTPLHVEAIFLADANASDLRHQRIEGGA